MKRDLGPAMVKCTVLACSYFAAWLYRIGGEGISITSPRFYFAIILMFLTFGLTVAWQAVSKFERWSWSTAFVRFTSMLMAVSILAIIVGRLVFPPHQALPPRLTLTDGQVADQMKALAEQAVQEAASSRHLDA